MTHNLTEGSVTPLLIKFTIPLVLGNLFQLTYNAVDSIIVGKFVGKEALAAVGSCNPVTTLVILFLNGLCIGAGILMGTSYGAGDTDTLERQVSTTMLAGTLFSVLASIICIILARPILKLLQVDITIRDMAVDYLRIIFAGLVFTFLYNFISATLRALGDSKTPLLFLIASSVINVLGDLVLVIVFRMGSRGCAISTVISELLCCLGCALYIRLKIPALDLGRRWFVFDRRQLGPTIRYGWASAMQQGTVQLGKIGVQAIVNTMGVAIPAAFTAAARLDDFTYTPQQNIAHAMTSFMAQNRGAGRTDRMREGFKKGMLLELVYSILIMAVCYIFAEPLMRLFSNDISVIGHGVAYLKLISLMYLFPALTNGIQGYFRGIGRLRITFTASLINMSLRVITAALLIFRFSAGIEALPFSYLAGWVGMLVLEVPILIKEMISSGININPKSR